jgi:hypothetical protein
MVSFRPRRSPLAYVAVLPYAHGPRSSSPRVTAVLIVRDSSTSLSADGLAYRLLHQPASTALTHELPFAFEVALSPLQLSISRLRTSSTVCVAQRVTDIIDEKDEEEPDRHNYGVFDVPVGFPAEFQASPDALPPSHPSVTAN